jgi:hypothetical protein
MNFPNRLKKYQHIKLDENHHVKKPLLNQLTGKVRVTPLLNEPQEAGA